MEIIPLNVLFIYSRRTGKVVVMMQHGGNIAVLTVRAPTASIALSSQNSC